VNKGVRIAEVHMVEKTIKKIELPGMIVVRDLAGKMGISPIQLMKTLMENGVIANINQEIDFETAEVVASEMGFEVVHEALVVEVEPEQGELPNWKK